VAREEIAPTFRLKRLDWNLVYGFHEEDTAVFFLGVGVWVFHLRTIEWDEQVLEDFSVIREASREVGLAGFAHALQKRS